MELLPEGNLEKPSMSLSVEWFYMTFHKSNRAEYVRSGCKLCEEMLQMLGEYFNSICNTRLSKGAVLHCQLKKTRADAKLEMHHKLQEQ